MMINLQNNLNLFILPPHGAIYTCNGPDECAMNCQQSTIDVGDRTGQEGIPIQSCPCLANPFPVPHCTTFHANVRCDQQRRGGWNISHATFVMVWPVEMYEPTDLCFCGSTHK